MITSHLCSASPFFLRIQPSTSLSSKGEGALAIQKVLKCQTKNHQFWKTKSSVSYPHEAKVHKKKKKNSFTSVSETKSEELNFTTKRSALWHTPIHPAMFLFSFLIPLLQSSGEEHDRNLHHQPLCVRLALWLLQHASRCFHFHHTQVSIILIKVIITKNIIIAIQMGVGPCTVSIVPTAPICASWRLRFVGIFICIAFTIIVNVIIIVIILSSHLI